MSAIRGETCIRKPVEGIAGNQTVRTAPLWTLIVVYSAVRFLQIFPCRIPLLAVVTLHVVLPALFALTHGARLYRRRGMLVFMALCLPIGNIFENLGVRTGFPFEHYYFTDLMRPKLFSVPILFGLAM